MRPATATHAAGSFALLITNDAEKHAPRAWAELAAKSLVNPDPRLTGGKAALAMTLKNRIVEVLEPLYGQPSRPATTRCVELIQQATRGTPWEPSFFHPDMVAAIRATIENNLNSIYEAK